MKVDFTVSHKVLDRIKTSESRLGESIYRPGENRCFREAPLSQSVLLEEESEVPRQLTPAVVTEPLQPPVEEPPLVQMQPSSDQTSLLEKHSRMVETALDEVRSEVSRLAANNRRETVRLSKRIERLEQGGAEQRGEQSSSGQSEQLLQLTGLLESLNERVTSLEEHREPAVVQPEVDSLRPRLEAFEETVDARFKQLTQALQQSEQAQDAGATANDMSAVAEQLASLQKRFEQLYKLQSEQAGRLERHALRVKSLQLQFKQSVPVVDREGLVSREELDDIVQQLVERQQPDLLLQRLDEVEQKLQAERTDRGDMDTVDNPLSREDGRQKSIVEELRYEIGEVRKSNLRQLEALNSKLNRVTTASEVNQMILQATRQLQHKIESMEKRGDGSACAEQVSTVVRF